MPTSPYQDTVFILKYLNYLEPMSVLDVGSGFGRWGYLCRCHLDDGRDLQIKKEGAIRIDAVEAFADNVSSMYKSIYNNTYQGDVRDVLPTLGQYDVIICSHMIEHLEKNEGRDLISQMLKHARKAVILGIPFDDPLRGPVEDNEYEAHKSVWTARDFKEESVFIKSFPFLNSTKAGVIIYPLTPDAKWAGKTMINPFRMLLSRIKQLFLSGLKSKDE